MIRFASNKGRETRRSNRFGGTIPVRKGAGLSHTAEGEVLDKRNFQAGLSLLFAAGKRPNASEIEHVLLSADMSQTGARVSFRPENDQGWVEILASGLTFDLFGLMPGQPARASDAEYRFGIEASEPASEFEAITIVPGKHLGGGVAMQPVVRTMAGVAANLAMPLSAKAVCWNPAGILMEPGYFARIVLNWLSGGAFPALGLTAVDYTDDAAVVSHGLAYFIGQELRLAAQEGEEQADTVKLAVRLIDYLVRHGPLQGPCKLDGPSGERLEATPSNCGTLVKVAREK